MRVPSKLSQKLQALLRLGARQAGSFEPERVFPFVEEQMTLRETAIAEGFLRWLVAEKRTFGWNLPDVYADFLKSDAARQLQAQPEPTFPTSCTPVVVGLSEVM